MLHVFPGRDVPEWVNLQDKFEKRVHVLNVTTLRIDNLTLEDSGRYRARESYRRGRQHDQDFHLRVYEPAPLPQIRATVLSLTPGWCNVTVECDTTGTREDLIVSWESEGLPKELEQRPSPGPVPNPWTLAVNLPLSQPSSSLTCVVSNQVDQKTATRGLGNICGHSEYILPEGRGSPGAQAALGEGSRPLSSTFMSPPATWSHSRTLAGTSNMLLPFSVSLPFLPTSHPCWSRQHPAGTFPHPHPSFPVCPGWFSGEASWGCQWSVPSEGSEPVNQDSGLGVPLPVSGLTDILHTHLLACIPGWVLLSSASSLGSGPSLCPWPFQIRSPPLPHFFLSRDPFPVAGSGTL
ncbi:uncharacterized protein LOC135364630 [Mirounga angustirostris]|uniref:uncharacterized protein LOC135364630 n=1 Tax=Mirounga angustirostris TaxID=9716 RepID=UPI00313F2BB4